MPRNGSGIYSKPAGTTANPNTTIESAKYNQTVDDLVADANVARPVVAGGTGAASVSGAQANLSLDNKIVYATKSGAYTALAADNNAWIKFTATATLTLTAAATLAANWHCVIVASGGRVTIDPNGSETINGAATLVLEDGQSAFLICDGTGFSADTRGTVKSGSQLQGALSGLTLSNNAIDATNDIDIAIGIAASDASPFNIMELTSGITKRLDAAWAVGSGNGGLDTGALTNGTYHVFLIQRSDTGVVDALFSASATSPTMPANYDRKRRIGSIRRLSGAILGFNQNGDYFRLTNSIQDRNSAAAFASSLTTLSVPSGIVTAPIMSVSLSIGASSGAVIGIGSAAAGATQSSPMTISSTNSGSIALQSNVTPAFFTNTSSQLYFSLVINFGTVTSCIFFTEGWVDFRGRI